MTDLQYEETKVRLENMLEKWHPFLQMGWHSLRYSYIRGYAEDDLSTCAAAFPSWTYRKAHITWYMEKLFELSDAELENVVIHEFIHVIIDPMTKEVDSEKQDQVELVTETLAVLFMNLYNNLQQNGEAYDGPKSRPEVKEVSNPGSDSPVKSD